MKIRNLARLIPPIPEMATWQAMAVSIVLHGGIFYAVYNWDFGRETHRQESPPAVPISLIFSAAVKTTPDKPEPDRLVDASRQPAKQPGPPAPEKPKETTQAPTPKPPPQKPQEPRQKPAKKDTAKPHKKPEPEKPSQPKLPKQQNRLTRNLPQKPAFQAFHPQQRSDSTGITDKAGQHKSPAPTNAAGNGSLSPPEFKAAYLHNPRPPYPRASRRLGESGQVLLLVQVSAQGTASQVSLKKSSGFARLDQSALQTIKTWKFIPARRGAANIAASVIVPVRFALND